MRIIEAAVTVTATPRSWRVLGVESSCDETGVAIYDTERGLLGHALHSQAAMHAAYGGVVPELASRDHIRRTIPLLRQTLVDSACSLASIDAIAYTQGPGLAGALLVGTAFAKALGMALAKPTLGVHHLEGHLLSPLLAPEPPPFPFLALLVSGGHTQLMAVRGLGDYTLLGETLDDAAGEAFDKSAQLLGLGYPGGPQIAHCAEQGVAGRYPLPRPLLHHDNFDFSFAGLKTAVLTQINKLPKPLTSQQIADIAAEVQAAIAEVLVKKSLRAARAGGWQRLVIAGGVGANQHLRERMVNAARGAGIQVSYPPLTWCTDNGAMIALAGALRLQAGAQVDPGLGFAVKPRWPLDALPRVESSVEVQP